ncbi:alpha/beta hydrolase [Pedobacter frigiditerrae]|uniref:alpha/beta hydrolase n=1 Tax=Pedobacter frigiditerrae TaxID=2530452 RepID=UPI002930E473|nr:alpha/beta hydrolase-fold protein [Pedobacter frigiditerrae]
MYTTLLLPSVIKTTLQLKSVYLKREVELEIFSPDNLLGNERVNLLLVNDGQDLAQMKMEETLTSLYQRWCIEPTVVIGIKASDERILEYGIAGKPDFKKRGSKAQAYTDFIIKELMPFVQSEVDVTINGKRAFAGFSLGGITAFDIAWNNDNYFDAVGVFSGSFWWRKKDLNAGYTDDDRIVHEMIRDTKTNPAVKFWLMTGTNDELADRNHNFIIDSIDDTIDVVKELMKKGYQRPQDIFYYEMVGGKHDVPTWAKAMPKFLEWAFPKTRI